MDVQITSNHQNFYFLKIKLIFLAKNFNFDRLKNRKVNRVKIFACLQLKRVFALLLLLSLIPVLSSQVFSEEGDFDKDGVADAVDLCPNLTEDYESDIDGCPSNFVPWYDQDYDGIEDHIDICPDLRELYNRYQEFYSRL